MPNSEKFVYKIIYTPSYGVYKNVSLDNYFNSSNACYYLLVHLNLIPFFVSSYKGFDNLCISFMNYL